MREVPAGVLSRSTSFLASAVSVLVLGALCQAAPVIEIIAPGAGSNSGSPVFYEAAASSPSCKAGISAMRIYSAPGQSAYTTDGGHLETFIKLAPANYNTVVQAWDNCGGVTKANVSITVNAEAGVTVFNDQPVLSTPVHIPASAQSPNCKAGINAMRVYVAPGTAPYTVYGNTMDVYINLPPDTQPNIVVQAWDNCGNVLKMGFSDYVKTPDDQWVYTEDSNDEISQFAVNPTDSGILTVPGGARTPPVYAIGTYPSMMVVDPGGWFIYASTDSGIYGYQVDYKTGKLFPVPGSPFPLSGPGSVGIVPMGIDAGGNFLYVVNYSANSMTDYRIDRSSGALTPIATVNVAAQTVGVNSDYSGQYVYAFGATSPPSYSEYVGFRLNQTTGALTAIQGSPFVLPVGGSGPVTVTDGYIYAAVTQSLYGYAVNYSTGALTAVPGNPTFLNPGGDLQDLAADRFGRYLWFGDAYFSSMPVEGAMQPLRIGPNGSVTWDGTTQDAGDHYYTALTESYTGKYLYGGGGTCSNSGCSGSVKSWSIESAGHLATHSGPFTTSGTVGGIVVVRKDQQ